MRVSSQLLRSRASRPLHIAELVDLSHLNLVSVERLELCPKLQTLNLRENRIESVPNLDCCPHLWKLDLANNKLRSLEGLCRFPAFGTLILSNNDLDWNELQKIRHMHILDLTLHGNQQLEMDAYYRLHAIDSLPNIWMLDGRIITSAERAQVEQFFKDTALCDRPVRHKLPRNQFVPTSLRNITVTGVHGCRTDHLMRNFPNKNVLNIDLDKRRLLYLAYNLQQDVNLELKYKSRNVKATKVIEYLISCRKNDQERCNMLLILLVGSLEFSIPLLLVQQTLEVARLIKIEKVDTMDLFMFTRETRCRVVSLLLSAVKIERDQSIDGGLYCRLYLALYDLVSDLVRLANGGDVARYQSARKRMDSRKSGYRSLLASEIVQLLCIVPAFFDFIGKDPGIMDLITVATKNSNIGEQIKAISFKIQSEGAGVNQVYQIISKFLLDTTKEANLVTRPGKEKAQDTSQEDGNNVYGVEPSYIITSKRLVKAERPKSSITGKLSSQASTQRNPRAATALGVRTAGSVKTGFVRAKTARRKPRLGDRVQLAHQACGRLVALPENHVGLVQLDTVAASRFQQADHQMHSKFDSQFHYVNFKLMEWEYRKGQWTVMPGALANQNESILPGSHKRLPSDNGEDSQFLSEALQQVLKLRVDLPFANEPQKMDMDNKHEDMSNIDTGQKALITDHVRSIVKECLEEAECQWPNNIEKPTIADEHWTEPERAESPVTQSEVTAHVDSESLSEVQEVVNDETEAQSELQNMWGDGRMDVPIQRAIPLILDQTPAVLQKYQPNTHHHSNTHQSWQQAANSGDQEELVSQTENARLDAWRSSEAMKVGSSSGLPSRVGSATSQQNTKQTPNPPPQRPSSPTHVESIPIKQADCWLAGGRNVSGGNTKRLVPSMPGWMEELENMMRRPKSSPGVRQESAPFPGAISWSHQKPQTGKQSVQCPRGGAASVYVLGRSPPTYNRVQSAKIVLRKR